MGLFDCQDFGDIDGFVFYPVECRETPADMKTVHFFLRSSFRRFNKFFIPVFTGIRIVFEPGKPHADNPPALLIKVSEKFSGSPLYRNPVPYA